MFFFIGGLQPKTISLGRQNIPCPECGNFDVYLKRVDHYISLFFIPVFPVKRGRPFLMCNTCNSVFGQDATMKKANDKQAGQTCPYCGKSLKRGFIYCPYCGKPIPRG
jgi:endogenous inhibitor of DNA gyrase (YacG/DUF329 family)